MELTARNLSLRHPARRRPACGGFTLVEICIGAAIFGLLASSIIFGLNQLNYYASVNRLYTTAQTLAQNQIDLILTQGPFDPTTSQYPTPYNWLRTDQKYWTDPTPTTGPVMYTASKTIPIYTDPSNNNQTVTGTLETTVKDTGAAISGNSLNVRQATVKVIYKFRNKTFTVVMETMRTSDT
jgi:type II secretory pathway pseudopilin PulG